MNNRPPRPKTCRCGNPLTEVQRKGGDYTCMACHERKWRKIAGS